METCAATGKYSHPSREKAMRHAIRLKLRCGHSAEVYRCRDCGQWHVGATERMACPPLHRMKRRWFGIRSTGIARGAGGTTTRTCSGSNS